MNPLLERLGIDLPIIQAPMAGGATTPELVATVSNAEGLGFIAGAYLAPAQLESFGGSVRELTDRAYG